MPNLAALVPGLNIPRPPPPAGTAPGASTALAVVKTEGVKKELEEKEPAPKPVVVNVQQELIGMLIGKGGETVKQLSKDSGARIEISKTPAADGKESDRCVYLSGSQECIDKAKQMIEDTLNKAKERGGNNNPNACTLKVPHELIGMLIGRGGETIKDIK